MLRFRLQLLCMDCFLGVWYVLTLAYSCFIFISFKNRGVDIWHQAWLQGRARLLLNLIWYLPDGYWPSKWCSPIDQFMDKAKLEMSLDVNFIHV